MVAKSIILCISTFLVQTAICQCIGPNTLPGFVSGLGPYGPPGPLNGPYGLAGPPLGPYGPASAPLGPLGLEPFAPGPLLSLCEIPASCARGFHITSTSPISPRGVTVQTESMLIEGPLAVTGQLPFLGVVALEGPLPAVGQGIVSYGCGNGEIGIVNELPLAPEIAAPVYPGPAGYGVGASITGLGYNGYPRGCGVY